MSNLALRYWPEDNGDGCSAWRLSRIDNEPMKFPRTFDLRRFFRQIVSEDPRGLRVIKRDFNHCMLQMSAGLPKHYRESFLMKLESHIRQ